MFSQSSPERTPQLTTYSDADDSTVEILVGEELKQTAFKVSKLLLCATFFYFKAALDGHFREGVE